MGCLVANLKWNIWYKLEIFNITRMNHSNCRYILTFLIVVTKDEAHIHHVGNNRANNHFVFQMVIMVIIMVIITAIYSVVHLHCAIIGLCYAVYSCLEIMYWKNRK